MKRRLSRKLYTLPENSDRILHYGVLVLSLFGLIMQISASMDSTKLTTGRLLIIACKQLAFLLAGYFAMIVSANYFRLKDFRRHIVFIILALLVSLLLPLMFHAVGGSRAWIRFNLGVLGFTIQPSEFAKIGIILIAASYLATEKESSFWEAYHTPLFCVFFFCVFIWFLQGDLGSAMALGILALICFLIPARKHWGWGQLALACKLCGFLAMMIYFTTPEGIAILEKLPFLKYQVVRFKAAHDPFVNRYGTGYYDLVNSLIGFNSGHWKGVGLGKSLRKYGYISAADTDFILAVIVEELGMGGFVFVLVCYLLILARLFYQALKTKDTAAKIILCGAASYYLIHFVLNVGGVSCLIPLTGIPLLLVSSGGSSTVCALLAIGLSQAMISQRSRTDVTH